MEQPRPPGLTVLGTQPSRSAEEDPVGLLLECHTRIRTFISLARKVAMQADVPVEQLHEAAARVRRYFTQAYPLHVLDEDTTLEPLLMACGDEPVKQALHTLHAQHRALDPLVDALVDRCEALLRGEGELRTVREEIGRAAGALHGEMEQHLSLEEAEVMPAARKLFGATERATLLRAIRDRRALARSE